MMITEYLAKILFWILILIYCSKESSRDDWLKNRIPGSKTIKLFKASNQPFSSAKYFTFPSCQALIATNCRDILTIDPGAKSGEYNLSAVWPMTKNSVYCDMTVDNGGYTFYPQSSFSNGILKKRIDNMTNRSHVLLYMLDKDGKIKYGLLSQLRQFKWKELLLELIDSNGADFQSTQCVSKENRIERPFLCLQFQDVTIARDVRNAQGLNSNGYDITFQNCDANPNSYMAFYSKSTSPIVHAISPFLNTFLDSLQFLPDQQHVPMEYFNYFVMHFGGCGVYTETDGNPNIRNFVAAAIGFK